MQLTKDNAIPESTVYIPEILLPASADMHVWAVNACDQFTGDKTYWREVENLAAGKVSAYHIIFPEIYLKDRPEERIAEINRTMREYLASGVFREIPGGFVHVERTTESGTRTGIVIAVDLEAYSFRPEDMALIRSTEATVLDRLPPRVKIRKNACLELPHVMLLYDDPENSVLKACKKGEVLYDFNLNMGGGHVKGTFIPNADEVRSAFCSLKSCAGSDRMLFAVGDGNHSLAAAKLCWEELKKTLPEEKQKNHPARYALCEAVNIYDKALFFRPIHRFIKTDEPQKFVNGWPLSGGGRVCAVINGGKTELAFPENVPEGIARLDDYISAFIAENGGEVDYIHGDSDLISLTHEGAGVILPAIDKSQFFPLILSGGNLPRKTFSMGEGNEKRYYIEAKRIK